jgi:hypothetical protein
MIDDHEYCTAPINPRWSQIAVQSVLDQVSDEEQKEEVSHPFHYTQGGIEVIDYIKAWNFDYLEGNVIKYVSRYKYKGDRLKDLLKARQYLDWLIERERDLDDCPF